MNWRLRTIGSRKGKKMLTQRRRDRDEQVFVGLARCQDDFVSFEVDLCPGKHCDVAEPLAGVELELDERRPFGVGDRENGAQLIDREGPPPEGVSILDYVHPFAGILEEEAVTTCGTEDSADSLQIHVGRVNGARLEPRITKRGDFRARDFFEPAICVGSEEGEELTDGGAIATMGGRRGLCPAAGQPFQRVLRTEAKGSSSL